MAARCPTCDAEGYDVEHVPPCEPCKRDEIVRKEERAKFKAVLKAFGISTGILDVIERGDHLKEER